MISGWGGLVKYSQREENLMLFNNNSSKEDSFTQKPVEPPMLDSKLRDQLSQPQVVATASSPSGFKSFYQANKIYFWAIGIGVVVIIVLAYFAFRKVPPPTPTEANVKITAEAPETVASGGEVVYKIKVENLDSQKLVNLQLELVYPAGMTYISSSPGAMNISGSLFNVPDLISGQNAVVIVKTRASGNINDTKQLVAKLHYRYANFNSEFVKEQQFSVRLVASNVILELSGPSSANNAQLVVYEIKYKNSSDQEIKNARVAISYPDGFSFASATPPPDLGNNTWNVSVLPQGGEGQIQIQGTFNANPGESKTATAEFKILGPSGEFFTQSTSQFTTALTSLPLLVTQELEGAASADVVKPGDYLRFLVRYQNNSSVVANGVNIQVNLDSRALDLSTLSAEGGQVSNNVILWNAATVSQLDSLMPSESGQLSFTVRVKDPATKDSSKNLTVVSNIKIKSNEYETFFPGNTVTLKIASPSSIATGLSYVSGSLPPQVGRTTTYRVRLSLANATNDYSDVVVTMFIPLGAAGGYVDGSANPSEAAKVSYDSSTGKLIWKVGNLPAHTGVFNQPRFLDFQVRLSPSVAQANTSPTLVKDIRLEAKDVFTTQQVSVAAGNITTDDLSGADSYGKGTVIP